MSRHRYYSTSHRPSVATGDLDDKPTNDRESELEDVKSRLQHELALQGDLKREIRDLSHKLEISNLDARKRERETTEANATIQKLRVAQSRLQHEVDDLNREKDTVERAKRQVQTKLERLVSDNRALEQDKQNLRLKIAASEESEKLALAEERELRWQLQELRAELGRKANQVIEAETRVEMLQDKIKQVQNEKGGSSASSALPGPSTRFSKYYRPYTASSALAERRREKEANVDESAPVVPSHTGRAASSALNRAGDPDEFEVEITRARHELNRLEKENSSLRTEVRGLKESLQALEAVNVRLEQKQKRSKDLQEILEERVSTAERDVDNLRRDNRAAQERERDLKAQVDLSKREISSLKDQLLTSRNSDDAGAIAQTQLQHLKDALDVAETSIKREVELRKKANEEVDKLTRDLRQKELEKERLARNLEQSERHDKRDVGAMKFEFEKLEGELQKLSTQIGAMQKEDRDKTRALEVAQRELQQSRNDLARIQEQLAATRDSSKKDADTQRELHRREIDAKRKVEEEVLDLQRSIKNSEAEKEKLTRDVEKQKHELASQSKEITKVQDENRQLKNQLDALQRLAESAASQSEESSQKQLLQQQQELGELQRQLIVASQELADNKQAHTQAVSDLKRAHEKTVAELTETHTTASEDFKKSIDNLKKSHAEAIASIQSGGASTTSTLTEEIASTKSALENANKLLEEKDAHTKSLLEELEKLRSDSKKTDAEKQELSAKLADVEALTSELNKKFEDACAKLQALEQGKAAEQQQHPVALAPEPVASLVAAPVDVVVSPASAELEAKLASLQAEVEGVKSENTKLQQALAAEKQQLKTELQKAADEKARIIKEIQAQRRDSGQERILAETNGRLMQELSSISQKLKTALAEKSIQEMAVEDLRKQLSGLQQGSASSVAVAGADSAASDGAVNPSIALQLEELKKQVAELQGSLTRETRAKEESMVLVKRLQKIQQAPKAPPPPDPIMVAQVDSLTAALTAEHLKVQQLNDEHSKLLLQIETIKCKNEKLKKQTKRSSSKKAAAAATANQPPASPATQAKNNDEKRVIKAQAVIRRFLAKKAFKTHRRRRDIAREMAETERTYVSTIGIMCDVYVSPLVHMLKAGEPIISQEEIDAIFSTIVNIRNQNTIFLEMLEQRVARWNITSSIGDAFMQVIRAERLQPHVPYIQNYTRAMETRARIAKENTNFNMFLKLARLMPGMENKTMEDLFINPVQRIPRYKLLLADLVKYTSPSHSDFGNLSKAVVLIEKFAAFINENTRRAEELESVSQRLEGLEDLPENDKRKLLFEGRLTQVQDGKRIPRYVFLFSDYVVFAKEKKKRLSLTKDSSKMAAKLLFNFKLTEKTVAETIPVLDGKPVVGAFGLTIGDGSPNVFIADTDDLKIKWIEMITSATPAKSGASSLLSLPVSQKSSRKKLQKRPLSGLL